MNHTQPESSDTMLKRRTLLTGALTGLLLSTAAAADFPAKAVRIVVPYVAGGTSDIVARHIGQRLDERLGQPMIIDTPPISLRSPS